MGYALRAWAALQLALAGLFAWKLCELWRARELREDWLPLSFSLAFAASGVVASASVTWAHANAESAREVAAITAAVCLLWIISALPILAE
jgi:hypothetical protein